MVLVQKGKYLASAATGQVEVFVASIVMVQVLRKGSVLDAFMSKCAEACERVRLQWQRVAVWVNRVGCWRAKCASSEEAIDAVQKAAHSIHLLCTVRDEHECRAVFRSLNSWMVVGRRVRGVMV